MQMYCEGRFKPLFRGYVHLIGVSIVVPALVSACVGYIDSHVEVTALIILAIGASICWGSSALFHVAPWKLTHEIIVQKIGRFVIILKIIHWLNQLIQETVEFVRS